MIPRVEDLASAPLTQRFGDLFNLPGLTNFLGCVQADLDPTGIRSLNFPPLATSDFPTANCFIDGRYFPSLGLPVTFVWRPDRIERRVEHDGLALTSWTALAVGRTAAVVLLDVHNVSGSARDTHLRLAVRGSVTQHPGPWNEPLPPYEHDNELTVDGARSRLIFRARDSAAISVQGTWPHADEIDDSAGLVFRRRLAPDEHLQIAYAHAIAATEDEALALYEPLVHDVPGELTRAYEDWDLELRAAFTPGNDRYSGSLPVLETADDDLRRLYLTGALGVISFKRDSPHSVLGRTYDTLMPRYWQTVTFLWDYSLSAPVHALLDPQVMRRYLDHWMRTDVHSHMGTEWLTGAGVGQWYSVNDYAMTRTAREYLRWTGDRAWLDEPVNHHRVLDELVGYARGWERFRTPTGLADYGSIGNLLECVSTYVHEVASLNAANVFCLRATADLLDLVDDASGAATLRDQAIEVAKGVRGLYREGDGYFNARFPDGRLVPVRHCYDLLTVLTTMPDDLSDAQRSEMVAFFRRELMTPSWMRALSDRDADAPFSVRPDHQWNGAYTAWPSETAAGLFRIGEVALASSWLRGLARSANQGPFGQAHFVEDVVAPQHGGAAKASPELPYINDWACAAGGSWVSLVLGGVFGIDARIDGQLVAAPQLGGLDPDARLTDLAYQGRLYTVDAAGVRASD